MAASIIRRLHILEIGTTEVVLNVHENWAPYRTFLDRVLPQELQAADLWTAQTFLQLETLHILTGGPCVTLKPNGYCAPSHFLPVRHAEYARKCQGLRISLGEHPCRAELFLIPIQAEGGKGKPYPAFWGYLVHDGVSVATSKWIDRSQLPVVLDLDETLLVAHSASQLRVEIARLSQERDQCVSEVNIATDPVRRQALEAKENALKQEIASFSTDAVRLEQYTLEDAVTFTRGSLKATNRARYEPAQLDDDTVLQRPVVRLPEGRAVFTRIDPLRPETSMIMRIRPGWEELRSYLAPAKREPGSGISSVGCSRRFDVFVCTAAERGYALEAWRLLDTRHDIIPQHSRKTRIVCVPKAHKKKLRHVFDCQNSISRRPDGAAVDEPRTCAMPLAIIVDDRVDVWEPESHGQVLRVRPFAPHRPTGQGQDQMSNPREREAMAEEMADVKAQLTAVRAHVYWHVKELLHPAVDAFTRTVHPLDSVTSNSAPFPIIPSVPLLLQIPNLSVDSLTAPLQRQGHLGVPTLAAANGPGPAPQDPRNGPHVQPRPVAAPTSLLPVDVRKQRPAGINQSAANPHPALGPPPLGHPPQHLQRQTSGLRAGPPAPAPIPQGLHRQTSGIDGGPASMPGMQELSLNHHQINQPQPAYPQLNQMPSHPHPQPGPHPQDPRRPVPQQQQQLQLGQQQHVRPPQQPTGVQQQVHQKLQPPQHKPGFAQQQQPSFGPQQQQQQQHQQPGFGLQQQQQPVFGQQAQQAQHAQQPEFGLQAQPGSTQQREGLILPGRGLPNGVGSVHAASANAVTGPNRWGMQQAGSAAAGRYAQPPKSASGVKQGGAPLSKPGTSKPLSLDLALPLIRQKKSQASYNPINALKEAADKQKVSCKHLESSVPQPAGSHPMFQHQITWEGQEIGCAQGHDKKTAKKEAAKQAVDFLLKLQGPSRGTAGVQDSTGPALITRSGDKNLISEGNALDRLHRAYPRGLSWREGSFKGGLHGETLVVDEQHYVVKALRGKAKMAKQWAAMRLLLELGHDIDPAFFSDTPEGRGRSPAGPTYTDFLSNTGVLTFEGVSRSWDWTQHSTMPRHPSPPVQLQTPAHSQGTNPQQALPHQGVQTQQQGSQIVQQGVQAIPPVPEPQHKGQPPSTQAQLHKLEQGNPAGDVSTQGKVQVELQSKAEGHFPQQGPLREVSQGQVSGQGQGHAKSEGKGRPVGQKEGQEQSWPNKADQKQGQGHKVGQAAAAPETRGHKRAARSQAEPGTDSPKPKRIKPAEQGQQASAKQAAESAHAANVRANAAKLAEEEEPASPKRIADDDQSDALAEAMSEDEEAADVKHQSGYALEDSPDPGMADMEEDSSDEADESPSSANDRGSISPHPLSKVRSPKATRDVNALHDVRDPAFWAAVQQQTKVKEGDWAEVKLGESDGSGNINVVD